MKKTWKIRVHKYIDGKWDNTIEIFVKSKKKAKEILFNEYLKTVSKLSDKLIIQDNLKMWTDAHKNDIETFTISGIDEKSLKKIKYVGEIVKD